MVVNSENPDYRDYYGLYNGAVDDTGYLLEIGGTSMPTTSPMLMIMERSIQEPLTLQPTLPSTRTMAIWSLGLLDLFLVQNNDIYNNCDEGRSMSQVGNASPYITGSTKYLYRLWCEWKQQN